MLEDLTVDQRESLFHTALIRTKQVGCGSSSADRKLRGLLSVHGSLEAVFKSRISSFFVEERLAEIQGLQDVANELKGLARLRTLTVRSGSYPLRGIEDAAPVLYCVGNLDYLDSKTIAVVGTRHPEVKDIEDGRDMLERLLAEDYTIVSGLAMGCDGLAHRYAVENGGRTIAVLGTPLDAKPVQENMDFYPALLEEHLIVSQYPVGIKTIGAHFAHRNQTTVSLSREGVVVIRAGDKSGTQHAIRHCLIQKKPLFVLDNNREKKYEWVVKLEGRYIVPNAPDS